MGAANRSSRGLPPRKRVLIVNCYFDELRRPIRRSRKVPQAMAPAYLAGAFAPHRCDIRLYSELHDGPLEDESLLGWPDMLVLSGLITAFDRMLHLTAYARTKNPRVIVVAGGPAIRALPHYAERFFDYVCAGDVEQIEDVIEDAFGAAYVAETMTPRFDLAGWVGRFGYIETSRYCNYRCSFCTLTGENRRYELLPLDDIERQIVAMGKCTILVLLDNNFHGGDADHFHARLDLLRHYRDRGCLAGWSALVTGDFFLKPGNLVAAREAGCIALFSGLESFDGAWLKRMHKPQNAVVPPVDMIGSCLDQGIVFLYGMMLDPTSRTVAELRDELQFVTNTPRIPLPSYVSFPIAFPRTPFFDECMEHNLLLPMTRLRDLDSTTLTLRPMEPIEMVADFVRDIQVSRGFRADALRHTGRFLQRYRRRFSLLQKLVMLGNVGTFLTPALVTSSGGLRRRLMRTHISTSEPLDDVYRPAFPVARCYEPYFRPTMLTDVRGELADEAAELRGLLTASHHGVLEAASTRASSS